MVTLYKRASAQQRRMFRIVAGAVKDAAHSHPEHSLHPRMPRSVAKRAIGTLLAQMPEMLAATPKGSVPSDSGVDLNAKGQLQPPHLVKAAGVTALTVRADTATSPIEGGHKGERLMVSRRSPLSSIIKDISNMAGAARKADDHHRWHALVDALRVIDRHIKGKPDAIGGGGA